MDASVLSTLVGKHLSPEVRLHGHIDEIFVSVCGLGLGQLPLIGQLSFDLFAPIFGDLLLTSSDCSGPLLVPPC